MLAALRAGKHAIVAKPLAASAGEAETLGRDVEERKLVLMVDHTLVCTSGGAVKASVIERACSSQREAQSQRFARRDRSRKFGFWRF